MKTKIFYSFDKKLEENFLSEVLSKNQLNSSNATVYVVDEDLVDGVDFALDISSYGNLVLLISSKSKKVLRAHSKKLKLLLARTNVVFCKTPVKETILGVYKKLLLQVQLN